MRSSRQGAIPSDLGWLADELDEIQDRLRTLEAPSGEALSSTVAKLSALVANIQAQLDAWNAGRWTNAQIDAQIDAKIAAAFAAFRASIPATDLTSTSGRFVVWSSPTGVLGHT